MPERQRHDLQMLVRLARAGFGAAVIEAEAVELVEAREEGGEVGGVDERFLRLEMPRDDQQMMIDHVELVEQQDVAVADIRDDEIGIAGKKGIHGRRGLALLAVGFLAHDARHLPHEKRHIRVFDRRLDRFDWPQRAASKRVLRLSEDGGP